jgi:hypothetical protein
LEGTCTIWTPAGGERRIAVADFVRGPRLTALRPGEVLRSIRLPAEALQRNAAMRRACLGKGGSSDALLIGTVSQDGHFTLTVTASTRRPLQFDFAGLPTEAGLRERLEADIPAEFYFADRHGRLDWCRQATLDFAGEICRELRSARPLRSLMPGPACDIWSPPTLGFSAGSEGFPLWG